MIGIEFVCKRNSRKEGSVNESLDWCGEHSGLVCVLWLINEPPHGVVDPISCSRRDRRRLTCTARRNSPRRDHLRHDPSLDGQQSDLASVAID